MVFFFSLVAVTTSTVVHKHDFLAIGSDQVLKQGHDYNIDGWTGIDIRVGDGRYHGTVKVLEDEQEISYVTKEESLTPRTKRDRMSEFGIMGFLHSPHSPKSQLNIIACKEAKIYKDEVKATGVTFLSQDSAYGKFFDRFKESVKRCGGENIEGVNETHASEDSVKKRSDSTFGGTTASKGGEDGSTDSVAILAASSVESDGDDGGSSSSSDGGDGGSSSSSGGGGGDGGGDA